MKKKIIVLCLVACLAVTAVAGATLAYFTAEDSADNVFTMKGIQVEINEDFDPENAELLPGLDINKDVWVTNTGTTDAYVRVHIAIPAALDDGDPSFNASNNFLHFNFTEDSVQPGQWSWTPEMNEDVGYRGNGEGNWNYYTATIDGIDYGVYVVTYRTALAAGEQTATTALDKVYGRQIGRVRMERGKGMLRIHRHQGQHHHARQIRRRQRQYQDQGLCRSRTDRDLYRRL